jgi:hypothetical protein
MSPDGHSNNIERREFFKQAAIGAGAMAVGMVAMGCSSSGGSTPASEVGVPAGLPTQAAWQFAIMGDTQWVSPDDGQNPNTSAIGFINQLNQRFLAQGVKFVVQVGDLADGGLAGAPYTTEAGYTVNPAVCEDTRALFVQTLYNNGIGFFACRGNHDDSAAAEFAAIFPQHRTGQMNDSPAGVFNALPAVDGQTQPAPAASGSAFTVGTNFSAIGSPSPNLAGLSYGFDYDNARLVFIDQFTTANGQNADNSPYSLNLSASLQQAWITSALSGKAAGSHAFVFSHKGVILQKAPDSLFGACPADANFAAQANAGTKTAAATLAVAPGAANTFIRSLANNGARMHFVGHDHQHNRSLVKTTDNGTFAQITTIICQSVSSKFYTPNEENAVGNANVPACTSNDAFFCAGQRQTMLSRELYMVGYYIVTVDGPNVTVDYYSAPVYPTYNTPVQNSVSTTVGVTLNFTKRETFGYSLVGQQFVLGYGASFTAVKDSGPSGTVAQILAGSNGNSNMDASGRMFSNAVNTGWYPETATTASDILVLWGMGHTLGTSQTDVFTLSMSYDKAKGSAFVLAAPDANGNWTNAVDQNLGGAKRSANGPWKAGYGLGSFGIDTTAGTVWAVLNYNGSFAAIPGS